MWDKKPEDYITKKEFMDYFEVKLIHNQFDIYRKLVLVLKMKTISYRW
jgi:hypothetical protein